MDWHRRTSLTSDDQSLPSAADRASDPLLVVSDLVVSSSVTHTPLEPVHLLWLVKIKGEGWTPLGNRDHMGSALQMLDKKCGVWF